MQKVMKNEWRRGADAPFETAPILAHDTHPEGLDLDRVRFVGDGQLEVRPEVGHILSVIRGGGLLHVTSEPEPLAIGEGVHLYLPAGAGAQLECTAGSELVRLCAPTAERAPGKRILLRDERFVGACATTGHTLRWTLTPQYLSRRIFLHHDTTLVSKRMDPISWFRTTMFDVSGLPPNADGESVFKMAYNSRTEINVCYEVVGETKVRFASHPYSRAGSASEQAWGPWVELTSDSSYHLNEEADGADAEWTEDAGVRRCSRNKHEVRVADGRHVSLFCLFDPAPTGVERHHPGEYSDYEPLSTVITRPEYAVHRREIDRFDAMVDTLSIAKARGRLDELRGSPAWQLYLDGRSAQLEIERTLHDALMAGGTGRERVIEPWMHPPQ